MNSKSEMDRSKIGLIQDRIRDLWENTNFAFTIFERLIGYAIIAADFDGNIIAYSEEGRQIYGYAPKEVIGKKSIEILFPESFSQTGRLQQIISDLHKKGKLSYEGEMTRKNGDTFPAQIAFGLTKNKNGKIVGFVVIAQDITERKRAEEALMSSEARFRVIIERHADGIIIVNRDGIIRFVNPAAESLFGRKAQEVLGEVFGFPLIAGETTGIDIVRKGGETAVAEMRLVEIDWEGERAYLASLRDVTEMYKVRKKLELLANLVEDAKHVMIFIVRRDVKIEECNALARETFGYTKVEMLSQNMRALFKLKREAGWGKIADFVEQESHWRGELAGVCKDGEEFPVDMAVSRSEDEEIGNGKFISFVRDVRKEKERERMKSEFISVASHEMRTPMTSIKSAVQLVLKGKAGEVTEAQEKFMSMADRNIDRLSNLIDDLLNISKIESGKIELNYTEVPLRDCIRHVMNTLKSLADAKFISLRMNIGPNAPAIYAEASRIEEALINLVGNAIKFTPENGTVTVDVREAGEVSDMPEGVKGFLEVSVADNGVGIPEGVIDHIFDKFYQVESSLSTQKQSGSGLGLGITKSIVEAHGGNIRCKSKEGEGSTFSFTLPIMDREKQFFNSLKDEISKAIQEYSPLSILVLTIKIADFEHFIEVYGERECAKILEATKEKIIEGRVKRTDMTYIAPWNGEIVLVMPDTDSTGSQIVQQRIEKYISESEIVVGNTSYSHLLMAGIATFPEDGRSPEELLHCARERIE